MSATKLPPPSVRASLDLHRWGWYQARGWTKRVVACADCGVQLRRDNWFDLCLGIVGELLLDPDDAPRVPHRWRGNWAERRRHADDHHGASLEISLRAYARFKALLAAGGDDPFTATTVT